MTPSAGRRKLARVLTRLREAYGRRHWRPAGSAVRVLVGTILSQNTSGANAGAGLRQLWRRFRSWQAVADAPVGEIERHIRVSGLSRTKAPRIRRILRALRDRSPRHTISLDFLRRMPPDRAGEHLLSFDGIGPKTAACVLMFAFGMPVFPVDTHIHRIGLRLGVLAGGTGAVAAQDVLTALIPPADRYEMHVLLIAHGRTLCRARSPKCGECPLLRGCPFGQSVGQAGKKRGKAGP